MLYFFQDGNLHIDLAAEGGTMVFAPAPTEAAVTAPAGAFGDGWSPSRAIPLPCPRTWPNRRTAATSPCGAARGSDGRAIKLAVVDRSIGENPARTRSSWSRVAPAAPRSGSSRSCSSRRLRCWRFSARGIWSWSKAGHAPFHPQPRNARRGRPRRGGAEGANGKG